MRRIVAVADRPDEVRARLQHARDGVAFIERELPIVLQRYLDERSTS